MGLPVSRVLRALFRVSDRQADSHLFSYSVCVRLSTAEKSGVSKTAANR